VLVSKFAAVKGGDHALVALNRGSSATLRLGNLKPKFEYDSVVLEPARRFEAGKDRTTCARHDERVATRWVKA
jgi:hypothetical protein